MPRPLEEAVVAITGASSGIGRAAMLARPLDVRDEAVEEVAEGIEACAEQPRREIAFGVAGRMLAASEPHRAEGLWRRRRRVSRRRAFLAAAAALTGPLRRS